MTKKVMDARWIAMFMICCTQDGTVYDQLPQNGCEPHYDKSFATSMGVDKDIQIKFHDAFAAPNFQSRLDAYNADRPEDEQIVMPIHKKSGNTMTPADLLQTAAELLKYSGQPYTKPGCPNNLTIQAAVGALNLAALINGATAGDQE